MGIRMYSRENVCETLALLGRKSDSILSNNQNQMEEYETLAVWKYVDYA